MKRKQILTYKCKGATQAKVYCNKETMESLEYCGICTVHHFINTEVQDIGC